MKKILFLMYAILVCFLVLNGAKCSAAEEPAINPIRMLDGIAFNIKTGEYTWMDMYINEVRRPNMYQWLKEADFGKHVKRIRYEANFFVCGAGESWEDIKKRVRTNDSSDDLFSLSFCRPIEVVQKDSRGKPIVDKKTGKEIKEDKRQCIGNPDDYIILVVRLVPDGPRANTVYLFTCISKKDAFRLGCPDEDVQEYARRKGLTR